jgi:glycosyltransferase involved in cell wall biosynthesis
MKVYIVELEPVETRYTAQWQEHLPKQMLSAGLDVEVITGPQDAPTDTTPGAFLNFSGTNYWKSEQLKTISIMFAEGKIKDGDYFLYTDAWNPTVLQLKYMAELLGVKIKIGGLWHAGSYDPADFLGRLIGDAPWVRHAEESMFMAFDHNFFATQFHIDLFNKSFKSLWINEAQEKIYRVGWPMEYMPDVLKQYDIPTNKMDMVIFPHRVAPEKQVDIFKDLEKSMPDIEFLVAQEKQLTKDEYHMALCKSKVVFSANQQETLGISCYEGALVGAAPMVPDRLSYSEMYNNGYKYPSEWTKDFETYLEHKPELMAHIRQLIGKNDELDTNGLANNLGNDFFSGQALYKIIGNQL